jgi:hypothetical protein
LVVVDRGGPTFVRDPIFSPINPSAAAGVSGAPALAFGPPSYNKMAEHDLEAQEALARDFQPALEVSVSRVCACDGAAGAASVDDG